MRLLRPALLVLLLLAAACAPPRPAVPPVEPPFDPDVFVFAVEAPPTYAHDGLRLATLNTAFLFDGEGDEGQANFAHKGDPAAARAHRDRVGASLRALDADVLMLQEVENRRVLELLLEESLRDMGYTVHFVEGQDTFTGQDVALLSRVPVDTVGRTDERVPVEGRDRPYGVSKNLFARLDLGDVPTTLVGLHLLARPDAEDRRPRREGQAEVIRRLVAREAALGRAVAILGDLNDYDGDVPDLHGHTPISNVLATLKAAGPEPSDDLRNVMARVPRSDRYTAFWDRDRDGEIDADELSAIDHVLLSPRLYERVREVTFAQLHDPREVTDHFPIVVTLAPR